MVTTPTYPFSSPIIFYSFNMAELPENTFINPSSTYFVTPHSSLLCAFTNLSGEAVNLGHCEDVFDHLLSITLEHMNLGPQDT